MKNLLLITFSLLLLTNSAFSQNIDRQWLIWNGKGKNSINGSGYNNYTNSLNSNFYLLGVTSPDLNNHAQARNDLFIIYADGKHFNSRGTSIVGNYYNATNSPSLVPHYFERTPAVNILYGYQTNIYEGDDLPSRVYAQAASIPGATTYPITTTDSKLITADHEVVISKDITLIINYDSLRAMMTNQSESVTLTYDGIREMATQNITYGHDILDISPVFDNGGILASTLPASTAIPLASESINIFPKPQFPYGYINLKPNQSATAYGPDANGDRYEAVFKLNIGGTTKMITEPIRMSHDPNFLRVESICKQTDGSYIVTYHMQFENTFSTSTSQLEVIIDFPAHFDLSCLQAYQWHAGGPPDCKGELHINGNVVRFEFKEEKPLIKCTVLNKVQGIGYVKFKVKVKPNFDVADLSVPLEMNDVKVNFDGTPYPLDYFYDLVKCEKGFPDNVDKLKYQSNSHAPVKCFRPITSEVCKCKAPICYKCIFGGLIIILLLVGYFSWKKMKKPTPPPYPES